MVLSGGSSPARNEKDPSNFIQRAEGWNMCVEWYLYLEMHDSLLTVVQLSEFLLTNVQPFLQLHM